jgi:hypothetical protein
VEVKLLETKISVNEIEKHRQKIILFKNRIYNIKGAFVKPETSDQPDQEICVLKCHYL